MCSVGHQVLTPRVWPCEGGGRPQSWHLFLSTVLAFILFIRKRQISQAKADWKEGRLDSASACLFQPAPRPQMKRIITAMILLMMLSLGCRVVVCFSAKSGFLPDLNTWSFPGFWKSFSRSQYHMHRHMFGFTIPWLWWNAIGSVVSVPEIHPRIIKQTLPRQRNNLDSERRIQNHN